jgi:hypothetical protein
MRRQEDLRNARRCRAAQDRADITGVLQVFQQEAEIRRPAELGAGRRHDCERRDRSR